MARIYGEIAASASMFFFAFSSYSILKATIPISFSFFSEKRGFVQCLSRKGKSITTTHQPPNHIGLGNELFIGKLSLTLLLRCVVKNEWGKGINLSAKNIKVGHFIKSQWITLSTMFPRKKNPEIKDELLPLLHPWFLALNIDCFLYVFIFFGLADVSSPLRKSIQPWNGSEGSF